MFRNRLFLLLVVGLSFSALASADSFSVNESSLHTGPAIESRVKIASVNFSAGTPTAAPMLLGASALSNGRFTNGQFGGLHDTMRFRAKKWTGGNQNGPMSAPEPGSLMLLSTGLVGIAGVVRRKLQSPLTVSA